MKPAFIEPTLELSFLWHMHQPDYRNTQGIMQMPWVFLHAIKDYYDMPWMLTRHSGLKATFNITPSLIEQILLYCDDIVSNDRFFTLWMKHPSELNETDRQWMIKICKSPPYETMIEPIKPYSELYHLEYYNDDELFDMEVWFILSWCGVYLRTHNTIVRELLETKDSFKSHQKLSLIQTLGNFISTIFPYYTELQKEGTISLSTTPLNHPILPLLVDMNNAEIAHPGTDLPEHPISLEEDAKLQISKAQKLFKETFAHDAVGFWPAEGAVDERTVTLYREAGLKWIATDETILFKSLDTDHREKLYHPYKYNGLTIGFRDNALSDLIGFTYRFWDSEHAADDFVSSLESLPEDGKNRTVFVILDGENAWEFYPNNAFDFFDALYRKLSHTSWCRMVSMDEVVLKEAKSLKRLAPGSWIHGEFNTWVGHPEKTRGWELIYMTKRDYQHHEKTLGQEVKEKILQHFLAAECSDWFWWYGDDHFTEFAVEFDELFRSHLIEIYLLMKISPPYDLYTPINSARSNEAFLLQPRFPITPTINGSQNTFFEWVGCGLVDETKLFTTMNRARGPIDTIRFGQNKKQFFCAFTGDISTLKNCDKFHIIIEPLQTQFEIPFAALCSTKRFMSESNGVKLEVACDMWLALSIDFTALDAREIQLRFEIEHNSSIIQMLPGYGELEIDLETTYAENWFV